MIKKVLIALAAAIVIFAGVVAFQPSDFTITRTTVINAPPAKVFPYVNDFSKWGAWSPWEKIDPAMKRVFEGPRAGVGAMYSWEGDKNVGSGKMTITESKASEAVKIKLEFFKPMEGLSPTEFTFQPEGKGTKVTWTMTGTNNFISKAFCLFMDMDKMVGGQFDQGLAQMKAAAESKGK
jgi:uncharacterized protein YndB with AHSA1/START domain